MLAQRLLTAAFLIPLVVGGVLYLPTFWLALAFALITLLGALEWEKLSGISTPVWKIGYPLLMAAILGGVSLLLSNQAFSYWLFAAVTVGWLLAAVGLFRIKKIEQMSVNPHPVWGAIGFLILVPSWAALVFLHGQWEQGPELVLFMLVLIWVSDSGAYFAGRRWGRMKLAPVISPGKTWEGVYGALGGSILCGFVLAWMQPQIGTPLVTIPLCMVTCLLSVEGDLFESFMKRQAGVKDSGTLLPGHGGVLDRIDSVTAAAPVFTFGLLLLSTSQ